MSFFSGLFGKRKKEMQALAYQLGMEYYESDEQELVHGLAGFRLFQRGRSRKVSHLLSRIDRAAGNETCIFDYRFRTGGGNSNRTHKTTVYFVKASDLKLPPFQLKPKNFLHKIGEYIGWTKDIAFDSHPTFTDQYLLQGDQEIDIRHLFHTDMLNFFSTEKDWYLEGYGNQMLFYREGKRMSIDAIPNLENKGEYLYGLLRS